MAGSVAVTHSSTLGYILTSCWYWINFRHPDDIDLFAGGISESSVDGGVVGPTFACIIGDTFNHVRRGDRFWYERDHKAGFTPGQCYVTSLFRWIFWDVYHWCAVYVAHPPHRKDSFLLLRVHVHVLSTKKYIPSTQWNCCQCPLIYRIGISVVLRPQSYFL